MKALGTIPKEYIRRGFECFKNPRFEDRLFCSGNDVQGRGWVMSKSIVARGQGLRTRAEPSVIGALGVVSACLLGAPAAAQSPTEMPSAAPAQSAPAPQQSPDTPQPQSPQGG